MLRKCATSPEATILTLGVSTNSFTKFRSSRASFPSDSTRFLEVLCSAESVQAAPRKGSPPTFFLEAVTRPHMRRIAPLFLPEWPFGLAPVGGGAEKPCNPAQLRPASPRQNRPPQLPRDNMALSTSDSIQCPKKPDAPSGAWQPLVPEMNATCRYWADHMLLRTQSSPVSYPFHLQHGPCDRPTFTMCHSGQEDTLER